MDFYFTDRSFNLIGIASTDSGALISITEDKDISSIEEASRTFGGTILFSDENRDIVKTMAAIGNYILYQDPQGKSMFTTIMEIEHDPKNGEHYFVAEDAGMDLINGLVGPYSAASEMSFAEYFNLFARDTGFEIRINEISNLKRTLEWEGDSMTIRARLISLATQFDNAEIEFSFEITGTQVVKRFVDIKKRIGSDNRITLYVNKDIDNIVTKANIYDLCTAINATGGTIEGQNEPINLKGYNYTDPNGRFVLNRTTGVMQDMESVKIWSRLLSNDNTNPNAGHITRVKTYETTNQKTLADNVVRELEKVSQPIINYETDIANLPENVSIGDTVYLVDEDEKLFLSARVLELTRIYSENKYTATLGDYLIQEDGINQNLKELAEQLKQSTTYVWIRYADDEDGNGISSTPAGKTYIAIKQVLGVPNPSNDPNDYQGLWTKFVGEGIPGPPGEDGQTTYTWLKYADDDKGTNMSDDPTGKFYIGMATNKTTPTESTNPADYKWQLVKGEDGQDAHIYQAYAWSEDGTDRFTTQYPGENLVLNTRDFTSTTGFQTYTGTSDPTVENGIVKFSASSNPGARMMFGRASNEGFYQGVPFVSEETFTVTMVFETNKLQSEYRIGGKYFLKYDASSREQGTGPTKICELDDLGGGLYKLTVHLQLKDRENADNEVFAFYVYPAFDGAAETVTMGIHRFKIEKGDAATIDTPSPKDDFANAYPTFMGTYATFDAVQSTDPSKYTWQRMLGESGKNGKDGIAGKDGVGISDTNITYAQSTSGTTPPSTGWTAQVPTLVKGQYLWTKTVWTYTDASTETGYTVSYNAKDGNDGNDGVAGKDGVGISNTVIEYVGAVSGTSKPISGWSTTIPTVPAGQYLWTRTTWQYTDGTSEQGFTTALMGRTGASGKDGVAGKDGVGIKSTQIMYAQSTSGTTAPTTGWTAQVPTLIKGQYLWTQTTWVYTDNTGESGYTVSYNAKDGNNGTDGIAGKDGVGIASTKVEYVGSSSGTVKPTTGWSTTIPTVAEGNFLWTRTTWTYTDSTSEIGYSVAKMGAKGDKGDTGARGSDGIAGKDGVGLKNTVIQYASSTSGTTAPTTGWQTTVPTVSAGNYLWTKNTWTYTDNTTETGYSVSRIGKDGNTGKDGIAGKDGVGLKSTLVQYVGSTSGTTTPTSGWSTSIPTVAEGSFLWTKTTWTYTDSTTEVGYSVSKMGAKGDKGDQGIQGPQGPNGQTYYTWLKYADTPTSGMSDSPTGKTYMGLAYNKTSATESTNYSDYSWSLIKGDKGVQGPQGPNGQTTYTWIKYGTSSAGAGMSDSPTGKTYIGIAYNKTTATESTNPADYSWSLIKGDKGDTGPQGPAGNGISKSTITYAASASGTTAPASGWQSTPPNVAANSFLWTRVIINYTDGTSSTSYSVGKMGAQGPQGTTGAQGPQGPTGNGVSSSVVNYAASTSGTTAPTSGWVTTPPTVAANQYLWTRIVITYTNGTSTTAYSVGKMGAQGPKGDTGAQGPTGPTGPQGPQGIQGVAYLQPTQPSTTQNGAQWFKTVSTTNRTVTDIYTYVTGSGWVKTPLAAGTLAVTSISAISANLGDITAGTINGVSITGAGLYSDFDRANATGGTVWTKGRLTMENGRFRNDFQEYTKSSGAVTRNGFSELTHEALTMASFSGSQTSTVERYLQINPFRINMLDDQGRGGNLTFQDVVSVDATLLTAYGNFEIYATSGDGAPTARRQGRLVSLAGAFKNKKALTSGTTRQKMGTVPTWARPAQRAIFIVAGSSYHQYQLEIAINGDIEFSRYGTSGMNIPLGYWFGLSCVYAAADF